MAVAEEAPVDAAARRRQRDGELARRVVRGDRAAERELLERLMPHLRAVARAMVGPVDADDAVQNALIKVVENLDGYRAEASLERWARKIATRCCLALARKRKRHLSSVDPEDALSDVSAGESSGGLAESVPRPVTEYLERLPAAQREAVVLRHALGYTVPEISELLEVPVDTIKSRLLYGRRELRKMIRRDVNIGVQASDHRRVGQ